MISQHTPMSRFKKKNDVEVSLSSEISKANQLRMTTKVVYKLPKGREMDKRHGDLDKVLQECKELLSENAGGHKDTLWKGSEKLASKTEEELKQLVRHQVKGYYLPPEYTSLQRMFSSVMTCLQLHWTMYKEAMWYNTLRDMIKDQAEVVLTKKRLGNVKGLFPTSVLFNIIRLFSLNYLKIDILDRKVKNGTGLVLRLGEQYVNAVEEAETKFKLLLEGHLRHCIEEAKMSRPPGEQLMESVNGVPRWFNYKEQARLPFTELTNDGRQASEDRTEMVGRRVKGMTRKEKQSNLLESLRGMDLSGPLNVDGVTGLARPLWFGRDEQQIVKIGGDGGASKPFSQPESNTTVDWLHNKQKQQELSAAVKELLPKLVWNGASGLSSGLKVPLTEATGVLEGAQGFKKEDIPGILETLCGDKGPFELVLQLEGEVGGNCIRIRKGVTNEDIRRKLGQLSWASGL